MSLLADAECPKVAFENVELKENNENGKVIEVGKEKPDAKCRRLFRENKNLVFLVCLIIIGVVIGIAVGFLIVKTDKERIIRAIPSDYMLPGSIVPKHYVLETQPHIIPNHFTFNGKVEILVRCVEETDKVILHSKGLTIKEEDVRVRNVNEDSNIKVSDVGYNETMSFLILYLSENMKEDKEYIIFLSFHGDLQTDGKGFYVSSYYDENIHLHHVASTQYEAIHAREGFPCFDEPAFKATFEITLVRWKNMSSLSNMPRIKTEERDTNWIADTFLTTMKMSTYTVAYYVGEYVGKIENKVRVWAPKHKEDDVDFSLEIGNKLLSFFENTVRVPYSPPKLDMVPVTDLVAAAMENWGLIIYSSDQLLYDKDKKSADRREIISTTVAHEIAHQWFGNLVTPTWWSEIWLSEGMTTYMENLASMHLFPEWNGVDKTIKYLYADIYDGDCTDDEHLTVWKNITAKQITLPGETFGTLTYLKGAMMGRMMHYILGNETFWRGISAYLKEYSYGSVEEKDMWRVLTEAQFGKKKIDMREVMWPWTHLSGLPIVTVERDYNRRTASFSQQSCKTKNVERYASDLWHIPISYTTPRNIEWNPGIQAWLTGREMTMKDMPKGEEWILVNGQSVGNYLVNYDKRNWELLAEQLRDNHEVFSANQRYKILGDANTLYKFGSIGIEVPLNVASYLGNERDLFVFNFPSMRFIEDIRKDMEYSSLYGKHWEDYMTTIISPIYETLGWDENSEEEVILTRLLRRESIRVLCDMDYPPCVEETLKRFNVFRMQGDNQTLVTVINKDYVICTAVRSGSRDITEYFLRQPPESDRLSYLACSKNETIINYIFDIFDGGWNSSYSSTITQIMRNKLYWKKFLNFLDDSLEESENENPYNWFLSVARSLASQEQKEMFRNIVVKHIEKVPEENRATIKTMIKIKDWESEKVAKIKIAGEWLEKRVWAK